MANDEKKYSGEAVLEVTRYYLTAGDVTKEEQLQHKMKLKTFAVEPARTGVRLSENKNLGNYEGVRIEILCETPCYREELPEAFDACFEFARKKLVSLLPDSIYTTDEEAADMKKRETDAEAKRLAQRQQRTRK